VSLQRKDGLQIEDDLVNFAGGKPGRYYGTELDGRIQWRFMDHFAADLEGAILFPGSALEDANGDAARSVYLVRRGLIKTAFVSPAGQELTLRMHPPGDVFGELCLCSGERREQAVALEASEVVTITLEMLLARLRQDPLAALDLTAAQNSLLDAEKTLKRAQLLGSRFPHGWID